MLRIHTQSLIGRWLIVAITTSVVTMVTAWDPDAGIVLSLTKLPGVTVIATSANENSPKVIDDHDDTYWHAYNEATPVGVADFVDAKDYRTTGKVWASELHVSPDGIADPQKWTAAALTANVTGAANITAGDDSTWYVDGGLYITADDPLELTSNNAWVKLKATDGGGGGYIDLTADGYLNLNPTGELQINGTAGWTGTFTNGDGDTVTVTKGIITNVAP
jgi:hypothetical protein